MPPFLLFYDRCYTRENMSVLRVITTPIGNLNDVSPAMVSAFKKCEVVLCESVSSAKKLYQYMGIPMPLLHRFWQKNELEVVNRLEQYRGKNVGLISDAGVPAISDPGYTLVKAYHDLGWHVDVIPGPCAGISALSMSGLASDAFYFCGFLSVKSSARRIQLHKVRQREATAIIYESPRRVIGLLNDVAQVYGDDHLVFVVKELTKIHQMYARGSVSEVLKTLKAWQMKGEFVVLIERAQVELEWQSNAKILSQFLSHHDAAECVSKMYDVSRSAAYRFLLNKI